MAYIDVDKFAEKICNFQAIDEDAANKMIWLLRTFPAADVAPKSEVEELRVELAAMRTAANSFKMHYEDLKHKYADLQKDHDELLAWGGHIKSAERAEIGKAVAREIFGEIEYNFAEIRKIEYANPPVGVMFNTLDYLKKKYTEEGAGNNGA
jgi:hypothetical protein